MLLQKQQIGELEVTQVADDTTEDLRQILTAQRQRNVSYDEARLIGDALVDFYLTLAEEVDDESTE